VSGDSAAAYLLQSSAAIIEKAGGRLNAVAGQLGAPPKAEAVKAAPAKEAAPAKKGGEFTAEEVAKHKSKDDVWVIVNDQVLNVTDVGCNLRYYIDADWVDFIVPARPSRRREGDHAVCWPRRDGGVQHVA
jgi:hypothetical protein